MAKLELMVDARASGCRFEDIADFRSQLIGRGMIGPGFCEGRRVGNLAPAGSSAYSGLSVRKQASRDDEFLHFTRALIDAQGADFSVQALSYMAARDAEATEYLDCRIDHFLRFLGCE